MFAVIKTGGKQYKVAQNDVLKIEKLEGAEVGSVVVFDEVLAFGDGKKTTLGTPTVKNMTVSAEVLDQGKDNCGPRLTVTPSQLPREVAKSICRKLEKKSQRISPSHSSIRRRAIESDRGRRT